MFILCFGSGVSVPFSLALVRIHPSENKVAFMHKAFLIEVHFKFKLPKIA